MKYINNRIKSGLMISFAAITMLTSCNKDLEQIPAPAPTPQGTTPTLASLLDDPSFSIFKAAVVKANLLTTLQTTTLRFTVFAPNDAACTASGITAGVIAALPAASVTALVSYYIVPQVVKSSTITNTFPNFQYPTIYNPNPAASALLRLTTFPSNRNGFWVNNIPLTALDITTVNGVMHKTAAVFSPPSQFLWDRLNTDADFTILKAAVQRADSGVAPTTSASLIWALSNIGPNLTLFAPGNTPLRGFLSALSGGAIPANNYTSAAGATSTGSTITVANTAGLIPGMTITVTAGVGVFAANTVVASVVNGTTFTVSAAPTTALSGGATVVRANFDPQFIGLLGSNSVTTQTVKGLVVYHILGTRAFANNFTTTAAFYPTLLNSGVPGHPGLSISNTFGPTGVTALSVKGLMNPTASNVQINLTPAPAGTSDQHYINGVLHKIDQVLIPQ